MSPNHVALPRIAVVAMTSGAARAIASALNELGFSVRQTPSVGEAAGLAAGSAAVFTEVALPDGNWRDLVEQVKLRDPAVPVILCGAAGTAELWWDALECGVLDIVSPPYSVVDLSRVLEAG